MKEESFSEKTARERAVALLDPGSFRELLGPFDRLESPHLGMQGVVPQSDDGVVLARGQMGGRETLIVSLEGGFQGGSIGEVNGAKIAGGLEQAWRETLAGRVVCPVLLFDTGGIRLQEANLGLLAISEIHAAIVALREIVPVIGVIAGRVGCFGGMSMAAALCSYLIGTEVGRLGLNGPEVIEQEAGAGEFDAQDRILIWQTVGCRRRLELGQIDQLVDDTALSVTAAITEQLGGSEPREFRENHARTKDVAGELQNIYARAATPEVNGGDKSSATTRGRTWFEALLRNSAQVEDRDSILVGDVQWGQEHLRAITVVPNHGARFPRARHGEVGLEEGWKIAQAVWEAVENDAGKVPRALLAMVDVPGQAFGLQEEALGIHASLAAAVEAYISARRRGHPVVALIVGKAISGAFLAHGMQASEILAFDDTGVEIHVMSDASVARITRRTPAEVAEWAKIVPCTARYVRAFASLGGVDRLLRVENPDNPDDESVNQVRAEIMAAIQRARTDAKEPKARLETRESETSRKMAREVRREIAAQWSAKES
jgi:malonate decarboxylase beta subunit